jgi:hypothetical protein
MGQVPEEVVAAAFGVFNPKVVAYRPSRPGGRHDGRLDRGVERRPGDADA